MGTGDCIERGMIVFIVDLPAYYIWVAAKLLRKLRINQAYEPAICFIIPVKILHYASGCARTIFLCEKYFWIFLLEPCWWRTAWRSDCHVDTMLASQIDCPLHPVQVMLPFSGFDTAPSKLTQAHQVHVGLLHHFEI